MSEENNNKTKRFRYRIDIMLIVSLFIVLITFCAYMMNTDLEETLESQRGTEIVTHDYTYEDSSEGSADSD